MEDLETDLKMPPFAPSSMAGETLSRTDLGTGEINFTNLLHLIDESGYKDRVGCDKMEDGLQRIQPYQKEGGK
jgi:hydroxypyruvate isomerase